MICAKLVCEQLSMTNARLKHNTPVFTSPQAALTFPYKELAGEAPSTQTKCANPANHTRGGKMSCKKNNV